MKTRNIAAVGAILLAGLAALSYSWTFTPYGRLDYSAALSLRMFTFNTKLKPDPRSDLAFTIPINLFFTADLVLPKESVSQVKDITIPGDGGNIPARVYWPVAAGPKHSLPLIVYFHGGGFVLGSVAIFDSLARSLANATDAVVVSVDYRLAPAHPYPAAVSDCYAALKWAAKNAPALSADASKLVVAGDSAGGNLATVVALKARDLNGPRIAAQVLYYPVTDLTARHYASRDHFGDGYGLSKDAENAFRKAYVGGIPEKDRADSYISPLYAPSLAHLPPALIFTEGFDPLTDGTKAYIARLRQNGGTVQWHHFPHTIHGFMSVKLFQERREALDETTKFLYGLF